MWNKTKFTKLIGIDYPIVQGPFGGGLSSVQLTSTVSNAGGLGSFGCQPFAPEKILEICREIRKHTSKPFNINLWVNDRDSRLTNFDDEDYKIYNNLVNGNAENVHKETCSPLLTRPQRIHQRIKFFVGHGFVLRRIVHQ